MPTAIKIFHNERIIVWLPLLYFLTSTDGAHSGICLELLFSTGALVLALPTGCGASESEPPHRGHPYSHRGTVCTPRSGGAQACAVR